MAITAATAFGISLIVVGRHRGPNRLDRLGDRVARRHFELVQAHSVVELGSPLVVGSMLVLLSVAGWQSALRHRVLLVTGGGALTCLLTDHVLQRIVLRYRVPGFVDTYPSGHVTAMAVVGLCMVAMVLLQRAPRWLVAAAMLLAVAGTTLMTWAVVVMRAHLFTDAVGAVLIAVVGVATATTVAAGLATGTANCVETVQRDGLDSSVVKLQ
jgi:membrane-associated phospholipid phosphatase